MPFDTEVLIIGAGMSGLGIAVQLIRQFGLRNFELIEKSNDVGGTWLANTYPGCGCDVPPPTSTLDRTMPLTVFGRSPLTFTPTRSR